ncbi:hypothetical protein [Nocardia colli]|uniref:hypothetical protein n=1 Tax=Nocardia colli TaxID=2545717 RepID=UPI0035E13B2B
MTDARTGHLDVLVPTDLPLHQLDTYIRRHVQVELAKTGEWPDRVVYHSGVAHAPGVMRWGVTYTTGPFGQQSW